MCVCLLLHADVVSVCVCLGVYAAAISAPSLDHPHYCCRFRQCPLVYSYPHCRRLCIIHDSFPRRQHETKKICQGLRLLDLVHLAYLFTLHTLLPSRPRGEIVRPGGVIAHLSDLGSRGYVSAVINHSVLK